MKINPKKFMDYMKEHPKAKYREIAQEFGCTHQWAQALAIQLGVREKVRPRYDIKDEDIRKYIEENQQKTYQEIADHFNISKIAVRGRARKMKLKHFPPQRKQINLQELKKYAENNKGALVSDIADYFGFSTSSISDALEKLGLHEKQKRKIDDKEFAKTIKEKPYLTNKELADLFNCSPAGISKAKYRLSHTKAKAERKPQKIVAWEEYEILLKENPTITRKEIAGKLGVGTTVVGRMLRKHGRKRGHIQKINKEEMLAMAKDGKTAKEIAQHFGVSRNAIWGATAKLGFHFRELTKRS